VNQVPKGVGLVSYSGISNSLSVLPSRHTHALSAARIDIAGEDPAGEVMALIFSNTIPLRREIPLDEVKRVFGQHERGFQPLSLVSMRSSLFQDLFKLGFPGRSSA